jgi:hypothetical protein
VCVCASQGIFAVDMVPHMPASEPYNRPLPEKEAPHQDKKTTFESDSIPLLNRFPFWLLIQSFTSPAVYHAALGNAMTTQLHRASGRVILLPGISQRTAPRGHMNLPSSASFSSGWSAAGQRRSSHHHRVRRQYRRLHIPRNPHSSPHRTVCASPSSVVGRRQAWRW